MSHLARTLTLLTFLVVASTLLLPRSVDADRECAAATRCAAGNSIDGQDGAVAFTDLPGAFEYLGFSGPQASELMKLVQPIDPQRYRFATDVNGPPTLDDPWTQVTGFGAAEVQFDPNSFAGSGAFKCNMLGNGYRSVCADGGPQPGVTYTSFFTTFGDEFPIADSNEQFINLSWPTTIGDLPTWQSQGPYVGDTWQGASFIPYLTYGPDPWALQVSVLQDGTLIDDPGSQAFGLLGGNTSILFVPTSELMQGAPTWDGFRFGFALHVHDGTYGSCETCTSVITPVPAFPRDGLIPFAENGLVIAAGPATAPEPTSQPATSTTTATIAASTTTTTTATDDGDSGFPIWVPIVIVGGLIIIVGGGLIFTGTRERQKKTPACSCTCSVAIEGPDDFGACCMQPSVSLKPTEKADAEERELDPSRVHLDADAEGEDGWDLFDAFYSATVTAECEGGGEARIDDASYDWSVTPFDGGFDVTVKVSVPVHCPDAIEHPEITCEATHRVTYHSSPCVVTVIVERVAWNEISHVDVQIVCGEYNEIFGYFPAGSRTLGATIAGAPGQVIRSSGSRASQNRDGQTSSIADEIGSDYSKSHSGKSLNVYFIEPDDCAVCEELRREWEDLAANPGEYTLLGNNCATQAYDTLVAAGAVPIDFEGGPSTPTGIEDHLTDFQGAAAASGVTISDATEIR
jgi:hypothetical protein